MKRLNKIARKITAYNEVVQEFINECKNSGEFDKFQMEQISWGFENGLKIDQVKVFADPDFNYNQMEEIRRGLEDSLSMDEVEFYANPEFDWEQMYEIRWGFEHNGLTMEQVKLYANPDFDADYMEEIRLDLKNGMSMDEVEEKYNL